MAVTIKDYFSARFSVLNIPVDAQMLANILVAQNVDGELELTPAAAPNADKAFHKVVFDLLIAPDISEDDFSIKFNKDAIIAWYRAEARRLQVDDLIGDTDSDVRDMSFLA